MDQANPFTQLAGLLGDTPSGSAAEIAVGEIIRTTPLQVRVGEIIYDAEDIRLCTHVTIPKLPGGRLILVSFDAGQTYTALGRV